MDAQPHDMQLTWKCSTMFSWDHPHLPISAKGEMETFADAAKRLWKECQLSKEKYFAQYKYTKWAGNDFPPNYEPGNAEPDPD